MKEFTTILDRFNSDLWHFHIKVPVDVSAELLSGETKRFVCTLNKSETFRCALMPSGNGVYFININKELRKKLKIKEGSQVSVSLQPDNSEYGMDVPEELLELLTQDPEGNKYFHGLTKGKQRSLIYLVGKLKSQEKRLQKAMVIVDYLKTVKGKLDFKELNLAFKEANKR